MQRIAILGPGLLGGSLALKLRALGDHRVALWARRPEAIAEIEARDCADEASMDARAIVREADLVVLCVPVEAMPGLAREIAPALKPDAVVTDVGSVKARVVAQLSEIFRNPARFVGSHPMAGAEHTGLKAARANLFAGSTCIVTPEAGTETRALTVTRAFWEKVGCRVVELPAAEHDECVALISHLPHLLAGALVQTVAEKNPHAFSVVGPGFRDTTRVASGPPEMWVGILRENRAAVTTALDAMIATLTGLRETLAGPHGNDEDLRRFLTDCQKHPRPDFISQIAPTDMTDWKVKKAPLLDAELSVPGDKSISHRSIMLAALANGPATITGFLPGEDCLATMKAFQQLGVKIERPEATTLIVHGTRGEFTQPAGDVDCGNSGTTMRLLSGILAAQPFRTRLTGDASLSSRPMRRIMDPLGRMGARIEAEGRTAKGEPSAPLVIEGGPLTGMNYQSPVASAQVKSAVLLAGLYAKGSTTVTEPEQSRDHTERMLAWHVARPRRDGLSVSVVGGTTLESRDFDVPGDISSAAFWIVAAAAQPGARLLVKKVGLNPTRTGLLAVLIRMGAILKENIDQPDGEPSGTIEVRGTQLKATTIGGREIPNVIDELPILAVAAALAEGTTVIRDAKELRVKETDRIAAVAKNLRAFGVQVEEREDGMEITGKSPLHGAEVESFGDHRIAMASAILALFAEGESVIHDTDCVATSYPGFEHILQRAMKA